MAKIETDMGGDVPFRAAAAGDTYDNSGIERLVVNNTSGGTKTVRLKKFRDPLDPFTPAIDVDETCPAGIHFCQAVPTRWYNRGPGDVLVEYPDNVTGLAVAVVTFPPARTY